MKLEFPKNPVEMSEAFQTKSFGFGDGRVLMTILRSKMYSHPINAICQEVMSNSRDANREVGKGDVPVIVKLPNRFDETISFIDEGPGITPDRMENVFILYGNSTKRGDNVQTGGFGLGAKTPFAYTDTFTITTTTQDGDKRHCRKYVAVIDESQMGTLTLVSCQETNGPTGTTISMAVKKKDIESFKMAIKKVGEFWKVRPIVKGDTDFHWRDINYIYDGTQWSMESGGGEPLVVIDGINYKIKRELIDSNYSGNRYYYGSKDDPAVLLQYAIRLNFGVGELKVTANREDLDYQPDVIDAIKKRLKVALRELKAEAEKQIKSANNLWDASVLWNSGFSDLKRIVSNPTWKSKNLLQSIDIPWNQSENVKIMVFEYDPNTYAVTQVKSYRRYVRQIRLNKNTLLVENDITDTRRPNRLRLITLFENNPSVTQIGVVEFQNAAGRTHFRSHYNWSFLNPTLLSTIDKKVLPPSAQPVKKKRRPISRVKELTRRRGRSSQWLYEWKPSQTPLDDKDGGIYVVIKEGKPFVNGKYISNYLIWEIKRLLDIDVYGILYKFSKKVPSQWETLNTYSANEIVSLSKDPDVLEYIKWGTSYTLENHIGTYYNDMVKLKGEIEDKTNVFMTYLNASTNGMAGQTNYKKLTQLQQALGLPTTPCLEELQTLRETFDKAYPLIIAMKENYWSYNKISRERVAKEVIFYINAKDKA